MKKCSKWILGILLVVSVFTFAGCKDDKKDSDGKIVLTVWESANGQMNLLNKLEKLSLRKILISKFSIKM